MIGTLKWSRHADLAIRRSAVVSREEYLDHMTFQRNARPLFTEIWDPIVGLKEQWEAQGASPDELDFSAFPYRCEARGVLPVVTGAITGIEPLVLEETEAYVISRDALDRTMRMSKGISTLPLPMDHPFKDMDSWLKIKPWYAFSEQRLKGHWESIARRHLAAGRVVTLGMPGGFDEPRQLMGEEAVCLAYYDQPELIHDMLDAIGAMVFRVLERVTSRVTVDLLSVHEDMAGRSGPLAGPDQLRRFIHPYYRRIWDLVHDRDAKLFDQDSDGDMNPVIRAFLDAGVNCMHPVEPAANMDIVAIRGQYGRHLAFYGGIDKHVLRQSREAIAAELEYKIPPMVASGGCVLGLDHPIPNGTPLENYRFYIEKAWEILRREAPG